MTELEARLSAEVEEARDRLREAEETIRAIGRGEVDAVVVDSSQGPQVYTLRGAEHSYRVMVEEMNQAAVSVTQDGILLFCNRRFAELLGRNRESLIGAPVEDLVDEGELLIFRGLFSRALSERTQGELSIRGATGPVQTYASLSSLQFDAEKVVCLVLTDLTEQKRNEEILAAGRLARAIFEQQAEATLVCGPDGRVLRASRAAERLCGRTPLGERLAEVLPLELADGSAFSPEGVRENEELRGVEALYRREGEPERHVLLSATVLIGEEAERLGWVVSISDITERKRAEDALRAAREAADSANRAKSEFLARMSHEIRTPMNGIMGMTELVLMDEHLPRRAREFLGLAKESAKGLLDIINDVLDLSRIEAGRVELDRRSFELAASVDSVLVPLGLAAEKKGVRLRPELAADLPRFLVGDEGRLRQVLTNLVANAVKFTHRGEITVSIGLADEDRAGKLERLKARRREEVPRSEPPSLPASQLSSRTVKLLFTVSDTGIGIAPENLRHVFDAFSQATRSTHAKFGGTGLGLSIAKQLVEFMGGRLWAESEPGRGSRFQFTAEFAVPECDSRQPAQETTWRAASGQRLRVLVAEDNPLNQLFAKELLERMGHEVTTAGDGEEVLGVLARERFDVVLMDVQMPDVDGDEVTRRVRAGLVVGCPRDVPIIALTAHAIQGDRERFLAAGMDDYLSKPFDPEALDEVLHRAVARRS